MFFHFMPTGERHLQLHRREHRALLCLPLLAPRMASRAAAATTVSAVR